MLLSLLSILYYVIYVFTFKSSFILASWFLFLSVSAQLDCRNIHLLTAGQSMSFLDIPQPSFDQQYLIVSIKGTATPHLRISFNNFADNDYFEIVFDYRDTHDIETRQHWANNAGYSVMSITASININPSAFSDFWIDWDPNTIIRVGTGSIIGSNIISSFPYTGIYPNKQAFQNIGVYAYKYAAEYQFWKQCTSNPTINPTIQPTMDPTANPTKYPSTNPTKYPSTNPTRYPSTNPTIFPTFYPSAITAFPTIYPTTNPTKYPSINPTIYPTANPTFAEGGVNNDQLQTQEGDGGNEGKEELKQDGNRQLLGMDSMIISAIFAAVGCILLMLLIVIVRYKRNMKQTNETMKSTSTVFNDNEVGMTQIHVLETPLGSTSTADSNLLVAQLPTQSQVDEVIDLGETDSEDNDDLFETVTTTTGQ